MSLTIDCTACGASFKVPDAIYERRIRGQLATLRCKKCKQPIEVDGRQETKPDAPSVVEPEVEPKPKTPEVEPLPSKPEVEPEPKTPEVEPLPSKPEVEPEPKTPEVQPDPPSPEQPAPGEPVTPKATLPKRATLAEPKKLQLRMPGAAKSGAGIAARAQPAVVAKPKAELRAPIRAAARPPPKPEVRLKPQSVRPVAIPPAESIEATTSPESVPPSSVDIEVDLSSVRPPAPPEEPAAPQAREPAAAALEPAAANAEPPDDEPRAPPRAGWSSQDARTFLVSFAVGAALAGIALFAVRGLPAADRDEPVVSQSAPPETTTALASKSASTTTRPASHALEPDERGAFNRDAAKLALAAAAARAGSCRRHGDGPGTVYTTVEFSPSGSVERVRVTNSRFEGTATGRCVIDELAKARVSAFSGSSEIIQQSVRVR